MIIETENLMKLYRTDEVETVALDNINMEVSEGEFVSIMGPYGCGKSTLLHLLGLIDKPSGGEYRFLGEEVGKYKEPKRAALRKANIGFIFQNFNLIDELTVYETLSCRCTTTTCPATCANHVWKKFWNRWA
jgi:putative ABC transport system ATP-binding protein